MVLIGGPKIGRIHEEGAVRIIELLFLPFGKFDLIGKIKDPEYR